MKIRFLIVAPAYDHQSGGAMILHNLCDMLNRLGYESAIAFYHGGKHPNFQYAISNTPEFFNPDHQVFKLSLENPDKSVQEFLADAVAIYPDVTPGNALGAKRIVRFLLGPNKNFDPAPAKEYVLCFSKLFHGNADSYLFLPFSDPGINSVDSVHWSQRTMDVTYYGKGPAFTECSKIPDTLVVTRSYPEDKEQLGIILRQCRYFFTWDSMTATNIDAIACGAVPVILNDHILSRNDLSLGELGPFPGARLSDFKNRNSVVGDMNAIDACMNGIKSNIKNYDMSWSDRVGEFAVDVGRFFEFN